MAFRRSYRPRRGASSRYTKKRGRSSRYSSRSKWTVKRPYRGITFQNATELKRGSYHINQADGNPDIELLSSFKEGFPILMKRHTNNLKFLEVGTGDDQRIGRSVVVQAVRVYFETNMVFHKAEDLPAYMHRPFVCSVYLDKAPNGSGIGQFDDVFGDTLLASKKLTTADRFVTYDTKRIYPVCSTLGVQTGGDLNHRAVCTYIYTAELNFKKPGIVATFNASTPASSGNDDDGFSTNALAFAFRSHNITFPNGPEFPGGHDHVGEYKYTFRDSVLRIEYDFTDN